METYDRILKWDKSTLGCGSCYFGAIGNGCYGLENKKSVCKKYGEDKGMYYHEGQIQAKIADAEAGNHQWVRDNTLFVCNVDENMCSKSCKCTYESAHKFQPFFGDICSYDRKGIAVMVPYRGSKPEKVTWPGRSDKDFSEVEKDALYICVHENCPNELCNNTPYSKKEWLSVDCPNMDLRKVDRSEYNQRKQFLKEKAAEMKENIEDSGGVEYVVTEGFHLYDVSQRDISPNVFLQLYKMCDPTLFYEAGSAVPEKWVGTPIEHELALLGFIGEKVCDPVVRLGDYFKHKDRETIYQVAYNGPWAMVLLVLVGPTPGAAFNGHVGGDDVNKEFRCKLSDLVGKSRLKEFKPVNVKIEVVED